MSFDESFAVVLKVEGGLFVCSRFEIDNLRNMAATQSKQLTEHGLRRVIFGMDFSDRVNKCITMFRQITVFAMLLLQSAGSGVQIVFLVCRPLQILRPVIEFVSVFVVDCLVNKLVRRFPKKCFGDEAVNKKLLLTDRYQAITIRTDTTHEEPSFKRASPTILVDKRSRHTPNTPKIGCLKETFCTRCGPPYFFHRSLLCVCDH